MISAYLNVVKAMKTLAEELRGRVYYVRRGAINWATFDFQKKALAIAIMVDEASMLRSMNTLKVTFEFACAIPEHVDAVDDSVMDQFMVDFDTVADKLVKSVDDRGDAIVHSLDLNNVIAVEFSDFDLQVQGLSVSFQLSY
jgi:hypothetical protein